MPSLSFVMPHWLYWLILLATPLLAMFIIKQGLGEDKSGKVSLTVSYFLLVSAGFIGLHRFYLKNKLAVIFIPLFLAILYCNAEGRDARNAQSLVNNEVLSAQFLIQRAQKSISEGLSGAEKQLQQHQQALQQAQSNKVIADNKVAKWSNAAKLLAIIILLLLILDIFRLPTLYRHCRKHDAETTPEVAFVDIPCDVDIDVDGKHSRDYALGIHNRFIDLIDRTNEFVGNFVAYWSIIAVFVYYYEVLARYVFNSPTNWAHESMFLMFGMQYLLAGGYVLRNNGHVRVDVFYMHFSARKKAAVDVATSFFFFIFAITLVWTGWTFFMDSYSVKEVSFTEWGIQYWPIKFAIPLGAALLMLQGLAWLMKDIMLLMQKQES